MADALEYARLLDGALHGQRRLRRLVAELKLHLALQRVSRKYRPDQPRVPAGSPDGGQWTDDSVGGVSRSDVALSAARTRGHHYVPRSLYRDLPLRPETRKVLDGATTGRLRGDLHGWSGEHAEYNQAVKEHLDEFIRRKQLSPENMSPEHARELIDEVRRSRDRRIRDYNLRILRRELQYLLRRGPRGRE